MTPEMGRAEDLVKRSSWNSKCEAAQGPVGVDMVELPVFICGCKGKADQIIDGSTDVRSADDQDARRDLAAQYLA